MNQTPSGTSRQLFSEPWAILLILAIAALLRSDNITQPYVDDNAWREASVAMMAENFYRHSWNIFYPEVNWGGPGPGYQGREFQTVSYIAALLYNLLGQHDWVGRCIALGFGLLSIFSLYQLTRHVWDEQRAILAAALLAIFPGVIRVERSFLPDPAMVALVVTSFWLLVLYLQTSQRRFLILATLVGVWGNLTKIPGLIVGLPMLYATLSILNHRKSLTRRRLVVLAGVGILSALPVAAYYLWARHLAHTYPPHHFAGEGNWLWDQGFGQWVEQGYFLSRLWGPLTRLWSLPGILLLLVGLFLPPFRVMSRAQEPGEASTSGKHEAAWLFHWWMVAGGVYYLIGARELVENPSNFHILSPAVAALSANAVTFGSSFAVRVLKRPALLMPIALALVLFVGIWGQRRSRLHSSYARQSYELGHGLQAVSREEDVVIALGDRIGCPVAIYYSHRRGWLFPPFEEINDWEQLPGEGEAIALFEGLRAKGAKWFGVVRSWHDRISLEHPQFAAHIERTCERVHETESALIYRVRVKTE